jgi:hypothetical protein
VAAVGVAERPNRAGTVLRIVRRGYSAEMEPTDVGDLLPCPHCGMSLPTRILADPVTLIAVGICPSHGTMELSRVHLALDDREMVPVRRDQVAGRAGQATDAVRGYAPGLRCGLRLGPDNCCRLAHGHEGGHTG